MFYHVFLQWVAHVFSFLLLLFYFILFISIFIVIQTYLPPPNPLYALVLHQYRMSITGLNLKNQMRDLWP
jgi:hypothetical protein